MNLKILISVFLFSGLTNAQSINENFLADLAKQHNPAQCPIINGKYADAEGTGFTVFTTEKIANGIKVTDSDETNVKEVFEVIATKEDIKNNPITKEFFEEEKDSEDEDPNLKISDKTGSIVSICRNNQIIFAVDIKAKVTRISTKDVLFYRHQIEMVLDGSSSSQQLTMSMNAIGSDPTFLYDDLKSEQMVEVLKRVGDK